MLRNELFRPWFVGEKNWGFEIISGEFKDVSVQIEKVEFVDDSSGNLNLEYHIIHKPELLEDIEQNQLFTKTVEIIINDILKEALEDAKSNRDYNTQESNS